MTQSFCLNVFCQRWCNSDAGLTVCVCQTKNEYPRIRADLRLFLSLFFNPQEIICSLLMREGTLLSSLPSVCVCVCAHVYTRVHACVSGRGCYLCHHTWMWVLMENAPRCHCLCLPRTYICMRPACMCMCVHVGGLLITRFPSWICMAASVIMGLA